jgi:lysophospholipase L1-like esterase
MIPTEEKRFKIEIVGDSITCGYGVEGDLTQTFKTSTENILKAWSYLTAKKLNADYSFVCKSGAGLVSGYTDSGERNTDNIITGYYDLMGCTHYKLDENVGPEDFEYDYSMEPDVIVILLGTNDISYCHPVDDKGRAKLDPKEEKDRRKQFYSAYKKFIKHIRAKNPLSKIVCALGIMGTELNEEVNMAVSEICADGDSRVYILPLEPQDPADGYGTDYHPSPVTQKKLSEKISEYILEEL